MEKLFARGRKRNVAYVMLNTFALLSVNSVMDLAHCNENQAFNGCSRDASQAQRDILIFTHVANQAQASFSTLSEKGLRNTATEERYSSRRSE